MLVLSHELAHAVDLELANSLAIYNNDQTVAQIAKLAQQDSSPSQLNSLHYWIYGSLRFSDPNENDGLFSLKLVQDRLSQIRKALSEEKISISGIESSF